MAYTIGGANYGGNRQPAAPVATGNDFLNNLGFGGLIQSAQGAVGNLLNGLPSPSQARTSNAYFGANSGLGMGSDFLRNRGYDLYGQQSQQNQQAGLQDLNSLISGVSGPALTNQGQQLQNTQFNQNLGQQGSQFDQNLELQQFLAQLQAMGLGNSIVNSGKNSVPSYSL
jgi:hypothetical protein